MSGISGRRLERGRLERGRPELGRLERCFDDARTRGSGVLVGYVPLFSADRSLVLAAVEAYLEGGVDVIQVGTPAPYPFLDGRTMARCHLGAFGAGLGAEDAFKTCGVIRDRFPDVPLVPMVFYSAAIALGIRSLVELALSAGVDALDTPDYPGAALGPDHDYRRLVEEAGLGLITVMDTALPLQPQKRDLVRSVLEFGSGFIFLLLTQGGLTGPNHRLNVDTLPAAAGQMALHLEEMGKRLPVIAVCGIDSAEKASLVTRSRHIDGVLVGSALAGRVLDGRPWREIRGFCRGLKEALRR